MVAPWNQWENYVAFCSTIQQICLHAEILQRFRISCKRSSVNDFKVIGLAEKIINIAFGGSALSLLKNMELQIRGLYVIRLYIQQLLGYQARSANKVFAISLPSFQS